MTPTWRSDDPPDLPPVGAAEWLNALVRGISVTIVLLFGVALILLVRLVERPLHGGARPWSGHVTVGVCRASIMLLGLRYKRTGEPMRHPGAIVANHSSWLDILVLNAGGPLVFVAKSEVAGWPGIGWLARLAGTVFVRRDAREAGAQMKLFEERFAEGHRLLFFPEGTSTDGRRVLPFKTTLFAALFSDHVGHDLWLQPVTVVYRPRDEQDARFYAWWGDMELGPHLLRVLAQHPQGRVEVTWHPPMPVNDHGNRKVLARAAEAAVRAAHPCGAVSPAGPADG